MSQEDNLEVVEQILKPLRKSQRKTVTLVIQATASIAQAASIPIAAFLSQVTGTRVDSALTRFYRLLHNSKLDDLVLTRQILGFLSQCPCPLLLALDWTEWHPPLRPILSLVRNRVHDPGISASDSRLHFLFGFYVRPAQSYL